ncbi:MAG: TetR/AcrR family transcriptional regulator [Marmoricola sp.]
MTPTPDAPRRKSEPRNRLLRTATEVFYSKGIHSVGIEEIVEKAQITRSTLYRHFPSKEDLVVGYLEAVSDYEAQHFTAALTPDQDPEDGVRALARAVAAQVQDPGFRGCAFLNAAAEYPDAEHPVRRAIAEHRGWFADLVRSAFGRLEGDRAARAELFVLLRDGAMSGGCVGNPTEVAATFLAGVERLLA